MPTTAPQDASLNVRYVVLAVYIGGKAAAQTLVDTAQTDLTQVGNLIASLANATDGAVTVQQVRVRQNLSHCVQYTAQNSAFERCRVSGLASCLQLNRDMHTCLLLNRDTHTCLGSCCWREGVAVTPLPLAKASGTLCLLQAGVTGDVSGGGNPVLNPEQEAKVSLLRSGPAPNIQSNTSFYLTAVYTGSAGVAVAGVTISGGYQQARFCSRTSNVCQAG